MVRHSSDEGGNERRSYIPSRVRYLWSRLAFAEQMTVTFSKRERGRSQANSQFLEVELVVV